MYFVNIYKEAKRKDFYSKDNYKLIESKIEEAKEAIKKAATMTDVDNIIKNSKIYIENINKKQSGCKGSSSSMALLMLSTLAMIILRNKKK